MKNDILDNRFNDSNDLKHALSRGGFKKFFELNNGRIVVKESDVIQVNIDLVNGIPVVKTKFPTIGNVPQIAVTLLFIFPLYLFGFPLAWLIAIAAGQLFSYIWYMPKIKQLKTKVEAVL